MKEDAKHSPDEGWLTEGVSKVDVLTAYCYFDGVMNHFADGWQMPSAILPKNFFLEGKYVEETWFIRPGPVYFLAEATRKKPIEIMSRYIARHYKVFNDFLNIAEKLGKENNSLKEDSRKLREKFAFFIGEYTKAQSLLTGPIFFEMAWADLLHGLPLDKIIVPTAETMLMQERLALLKIAIKAKSNPERNLEEDYSLLSKEFGWTGLSYFEGNLRTAGYFQRKVRQLAENNPVAILEKIRSEKQKIAYAKEQAINYHNLDYRQKKIAELASEIVFIRTWRDEACNKAIGLFMPVLNQICKELKITSAVLAHMTPTEVINALKNKEMPVSANTLKERIKAFAVYANKNKEILVVTGQKIERIKEDAPGINDFKDIELRGMVAFPGFVKGRVKVLKSIREAHKLEKGDILVAKSTSPDWTPLLAKVAAIITDVGGLTSHTAVLSREMHKPCIIGTKHATRILKDGDLIEVDAEKGIIRKIK